MKRAFTDLNNPNITESWAELPGLGFKVRVLETGSGPTVLFLHGNPDCADEWRNLMGLVSTRFHCLAPDLPGYGKSPRPPRSFAYDLESQCAFVTALLAAKAIDGPVYVVVHDVGGFVGIPWVHRNLNRTAGLLILNTVAFEGFEWFPIAKRFGARSLSGRALARLMMFAIGRRNGTRFRRMFAAQSPRLASKEIVRFTKSFALNANAKDATIRQFRHATKPDFFTGFDTMNREISTRLPTQVVWGGSDVYLPDDCAHRFGSARVTMLPDVGHWVPIVAPNKVAEKLDQLVSAGMKR